MNETKCISCFLLHIFLCILLSCVTQGTHAGIIMSYFRFYICKAMRKVLFLPILSERSYKGLFFCS